MSERTATAEKAAPSSAAISAAGLLQRKCACGNGTMAGGECEECRRTHVTVQRSATGSAQPEGWRSSVADTLYSSGRPLPSDVRGFMETRFRHDFSRVRVHDDASAARSARAVHALAYTVGHDLVFAAGQFAPQSAAGSRLLAHELAHTIQQDSASASGSVQMCAEIDRPGSMLEGEADAAADNVLVGRVPSIVGHAASARLQLQEDPTHVTRRRPTEDGYVDITRIIEEKPCTRTAGIQTTPASDMLYFDRDAGAFGIRYSYCHGTAVVELDSQARYDRLRNDASQLLQNLPQTALGGGDVLGQISQAVRQTSIGASTSVAVTVSGILRAELRGSTEQGLQSRSYDIEGLLRLTPGGWALELDAQYQNIADQLTGIVESVSFTPRVNIGPVQAGVTVEHRESRPSTGAPTSSTSVRGTAAIATGRGLGFTLSGSSENGGTFSVSFGTVDRSPSIQSVPSVECFTRDCPPARVRFECNRVHSAHTKDIEIQSPGHQVIQLQYVLDSTTPTDPDLYRSRVDNVVDLMRNHYVVQSIEGFASPEASRAYNQALSVRRARQARSDIESRLVGAEAPPSSGLPAEQGHGELLGESERGTGGAHNERLIADIGARLGSLSEAQQFELFGVDPSTLDETGRADMRARIREFRQGGRGMSLRARWERVFPFLRRVDVTLERPRVTQAQPVAERSDPGSTCDTDSINWAGHNMPQLPPDRRLPKPRHYGF
jgi:hypothetical protein